MVKDFDNWNIKKQTIHNEGSLPTFKEREIWWCSLGVNIGCEQDGKGIESRRPILVIKKYNKNQLLALPLSSIIKEHHYRYNFENNGVITME